MKSITKYLELAYPELAPTIKKSSPLKPLKAQNICILRAVTKVVIGQMLSRQAASTIFSRVEPMFEVDKTLRSFKPQDFRIHGVSGNKAKTILLFSELYFEQPERFKQWPNLSLIELQAEVQNIWGISDWTISMLALFYFGNKDVFPTKDGTINKVLKLLNDKKIKIEPEKAKPYRSYLALILWKIKDEGLIK